MLSKQAKKKLDNLTPKNALAIAEGIKFLGLNPDDHRLDISKLSGISSYRLRIGSWRIIYSREDFVKIIKIIKIGARGDVYK